MSIIQNSHIIAAAIGATIGVISAATVLIYNKLMERKQHSSMNINIDNVNRKVLDLQAEIDELRKQQANLQNSRKRKIKRQVYSNDNSYSGIDNVDIDTYSIAGTDIGDEEFFDCSDDEGSDIENKTIEEPVEEDPELLELFKDHENYHFYINSYDKLKIALKKNPCNVEIVWRFARSCYHCSLKDHDKHKDYIYEGCDACEEVLDVHDGRLYEWYAVLIGVKSKFLPLKERITCGFEFKMYVEKALEINPDNGFLYYLMGRFKYEICELNWLEKKLASTFFTELPSGTFEDAISNFERAEELLKEPNYVNKLYLAKSFIAIGKIKEGVTWLSKIKDVEATNIEDIKVLNEAEILLKKYSDYNT